MEVREEQFSAEEVTGLVMKIDSANIVFEAAETEAQIRIRVELEPQTEYSSTVKDDGTLVLSYRFRENKRQIHTENLPQITLVLPEKKRFQKIRLKLGAGTADMRKAALCGDTIKLETGVGAIRAHELCAEKSIRMETGTGKFELGNVRTKKASIECGMGKVHMGGKIERELVVECGMGQCDIRLEGKETDYNYEVSCGMGKVSVNGNRMNGLAGKHVQNGSEAAGDIKISCGMGKVMLNIA